MASAEVPDNDVADPNFAVKRRLRCKRIGIFMEDDLKRVDYVLISCGTVPRGSSSHHFSISFGGSKPSFGRSILSFGGSKPSFGGSKRSETFRTAPCKAYSGKACSSFAVDL